jgi:hypothetical protein
MLWWPSPEGVRVMSDKDRERAEQCICEAQGAIVPELRRLFLDMAECWSRLAQQCDSIERLAEGSKMKAPVEPLPTWDRPAANVVDIARWRELHPRKPALIVPGTH